jgi:hypothetical protein
LSVLSATYVAVKVVLRGAGTGMMFADDLPIAGSDVDDLQ